VVRDSGATENHLAVLNKIDGLWDGLKTAYEIDIEVQRQIGVVSHRLDLPSDRIFAVSAQKGLVAKVMRDERLLAASRLPVLENALVELLVPAKQKIVRAQTLALLERIGEEVRQTLATRERSLIEQLYEMRALQGKNQSSVERMLLRAQVESAEFEKVARKVVATRFVLNKLAEQALSQLKREALRTQAIETREQMRKAWMPTKFPAIIGEYFDALREHLLQTNERIAEMEKMVAGVQSNFAQELGWSLAPPMSFSIDSYLNELDRMQEVAKVQFGTFVVLTRGKWGLIERFLETVVAKSRDLFVAAERDVEAWVGSLLPPIETQVHEQRAQLIKRAEAVQKIRDAQESLEGRIEELEAALEEVHDKVGTLKVELGHARELACGVARTAETALTAGISVDELPMLSSEELGLVPQRVSA
jgi:hypothetical protein